MFVNLGLSLFFMCVCVCAYRKLFIGGLSWETKKGETVMKIEVGLVLLYTPLPLEQYLLRTSRQSDSFTPCGEVRGVVGWQLSVPCTLG